MITDFLGIVEVFKCTEEILARRLLEFLVKIGLNKKKMHSLSIDGAANNTYVIVLISVQNMHLKRFLIKSNFYEKFLITFLTVL